MYISQAVGYALDGLLRLSVSPQGKLIHAGELARSIGASESYLAKVFQTLARAGLVVSLRGVKGGYALARSADQITARQVVEAVEGRFPKDRCVLRAHSVGTRGEKHCEACPVTSVLSQAYHQLLEQLDGITIEELGHAVLPGIAVGPGSGSEHRKLSVAQQAISSTR